MDRCKHGYHETPSQYCPWCLGIDTSAYSPVVGLGNGWLLKKEDDLVCEGCGGPREAGWGAWSSPEPPTPENVRASLSTMRFCYLCTREGKAMLRSSKKGEALTVDELKTSGCPDCGKRFVEPLICPRLTCGSRFTDVDGRVVRTTDAAPDRPLPNCVVSP